MRRSTSRVARFRRIQTRAFVMSFVLVLLLAGGTVAEAPEESRDEAAVSDAGQPSAEEVAEEILEIQQSLGGSIVSDRKLLQKFTPPKRVDQAEVTDFPVAAVQLSSTFSENDRKPNLESTDSTEVDLLRDAAWNLVQSAEKLERSELYKQADALRELAQQFRLDARALSVGLAK